METVLYALLYAVIIVAAAVASVAFVRCIERIDGRGDNQ